MRKKMTVKERLPHLQKYYSEKIMDLFAKEGIPEEMKPPIDVGLKAGISYEEAEKILEYTISQLKKKPIIFNP